MITDALLTAVFGCLSALLDLLPNWDPGLSNNFNAGLFKAIYEVNHIIPIALIFTMIGLYTAMRFALMSWDFIVFVYHQFWGSD